ncbi:hypothetical protein A1OE_655 [Candidatus Endolissoclinum faulkneri L2]|uniref:Uncharacterized protein n=1 Tax=Candidatus Endolissoclinum faulkneri L2 TaxID=1193729 RepID=K7Z4A0_9PROT|nr:hypothetical protein A1OE_655 [Candidatus Endolissoclinum faulkneri L2]
MIQSIKEYQSFSVIKQFSTCYFVYSKKHINLKENKLFIHYT